MPEFQPSDIIHPSRVAELLSSSGRLKVTEADVRLSRRREHGARLFDCEDEIFRSTKPGRGPKESSVATLTIPKMTPISVCRTGLAVLEGNVFTPAEMAVLKRKYPRAFTRRVKPAAPTPAKAASTAKPAPAGSTLPDDGRDNLQRAAAAIDRQLKRALASQPKIK